MDIVIEIEPNWNTDSSIADLEPRVYLTDDIERAYELQDQGRVVVPILNDDNSEYDMSDFRFVVTDPDDVEKDFYVKVWQRYAGLPWHILDTERLSIREMTEADLDSLYKLYADESVTRYMEPLFPEYESELEYTRNYRERVYGYFGFGTWIIERLEDGQIIGRAGFNYREGYEEPELGYMLGVDYQHKGYALEACRAIVRYGIEELGFRRIQAFTDESNEASVRLLKRLDFKPAGDESELIRYIREE